MSKRKISLQDLPAELNLMIIDHLSLESCLALSKTCKLFQQLVDLEKWMKKIGKLGYCKEVAIAVQDWGGGYIMNCAKCMMEITRYVYPEIQSEKFPNSWVDENLTKVFESKMALGASGFTSSSDRFDRLCIDCAVTQENYCIEPWGVNDRSWDFWFHCDFHDDYVTSGAYCLRCHSCSDCWDIESIEPKDKRFARYHPKMPPCTKCWSMNTSLEESNNNCSKEEEKKKAYYGSVTVCDCERDFCKIPKHTHEVVDVKTMKKTMHYSIPDFDPHPTRESYVRYNPYL